MQTPVASGSVLRVVLGDWVYVGIQLFSSDLKLKVVIEQCYASPSPSPNATSPQHYLIRDRYVTKYGIVAINVYKRLVKTKMRF